MSRGVTTWVLSRSNAEGAEVTISVAIPGSGREAEASGSSPGVTMRVLSGSASAGIETSPEAGSCAAIVSAFLTSNGQNGLGATLRPIWGQLAHQFCAALAGLARWKSPSAEKV